MHGDLGSLTCSLLVILTAFGARAGDIHPAQLGPVPETLPDTFPWELAHRCSLEGLAQTWAGDGARRCRSNACLLAAQSRHAAAYLLDGDSIHVVNARGARVLTMPGSAWLEEVKHSLNPDVGPESVAFSVRGCDRFGPAPTERSPPACVGGRLLTDPEVRPRWRCRGPIDPGTLPPERAHDPGALRMPLPLAPEAWHGGLLSDGRIPAEILSRGQWTVMTVDLPRTIVEPPVHVHESGDLLLLVDSGNVEAELDGHDVISLGRDEWMYLPAHVAHRMAILDEARVTIHVSGGEPCRELRVSGVSPQLDRSEEPTWVRQPTRVGRPECDRSPLGRNWAGKDAIDCGIVGHESSDSGYRCAMWAQEHQRPFFLVENRTGIDSAVSDVLVRTAAGTSFEIQLSGYNTYTILFWRACAGFDGPSWRGRRVRGELACIPTAIDPDAIQRVTGGLGGWNCSAGDHPPEMPPRAREASESLRNGGVSGLYWPAAAIESLGRGVLDVRVIEREGCIGKERPDQPEVWFLSDAWNAHPPAGISIPAKGDRTFALRMFRWEGSALVYRTHSDRPWPAIFAKCPEIIRTPGKLQGLPRGNAP